MIQTQRQESQADQYTFTVGNITGQGVTLVDKQYNIIQLPRSILPFGSSSGSIIKLILKRDFQSQKRQQQELNKLLNKLQAGQHVVDTIIGMEDDLDSSLRGVQIKQSQKQVDNNIRLKQKIQQPEQIKNSHNVQNPMKKKSKVQEPIQQNKVQTIQKISSEKQKSIQKQKSAGRRNSSAMKKAKPTSNQNS